MSSTLISNNISEIKPKPVYENSLIKKLREQNTNTINLFTLRNNFFGLKNIDMNTDISNNTYNSNIFSFDYQIQQRYRFPLSVKSNKSKYKTIVYDKNQILLKKSKNFLEFDNYYKFFSSEFYTKRNFINNIIKYNNKHTIATNKKLVKYGVLDNIKPKFRNINLNYNFRLLGNIDNKMHTNNRTLYKENSDNYIMTKKPIFLKRLKNDIKNEHEQIDINDNNIND